MILLTALAAPSVGQSTFQWPDSSKYWRVLVNVNQYIENYTTSHPKWFAQDKLVTDFSVIDANRIGHDQAVQQYQKIHYLLESRGMCVGTYVSGTTVMPEPEQSTYPPRTVSIEQMPVTAHYMGFWPQHPSRKIIDLTDPDTRHAIQANIKQLWNSLPAPVRFVDNAAVHQSTGRAQPWEAYCEHMKEISQLGEALGSRIIFNISMHVGMLSDQDIRELMQAVGTNGIALEMPWHRVIRQDKEASERAQNRYRQLLDSGMAVILIPIDTPEDALSEWVRSWRKPTDHVYISGAFFKQPDGAIYSLQ